MSRQTNARLSLTSGNSFLTWSVVVVVPVTIDELLLVVEVPDVLILRLEAALASCSSRALNSSLCDGIVDSGERSAEQVEEVVLEVHAAEDAGQILVEAVVGDGQPDSLDKGSLHPGEPVVRESGVLGLLAQGEGDQQAKNAEKFCNSHIYF